MFFVHLFLIIFYFRYIKLLQFFFFFVKVFLFKFGNKSKNSNVVNDSAKNESENSNTLIHSANINNDLVSQEVELTTQFQHNFLRLTTKSPQPPALSVGGCCEAL